MYRVPMRDVRRRAACAPTVHTRLHAASVCSLSGPRWGDRTGQLAVMYCILLKGVYGEPV